MVSFTADFWFSEIKVNMSAEELMIGDWVKFKNSDLCHQVYAVQGKSVKVDKQYWHKDDNLHPIPLTGEILKANGFNREGGASYWHEGDRDACILHWNKDKDQLVIGSPCDECMVKMNVRYVHELQHAFKLAGIDFNIKL